MGTRKTHHKLFVWQEAMKLAEMVHQLTAGFPREERFSLALQMRRTALSVPSNLAEGAGRNGPKELLQFVGFASGSLAELETQIELAVRLKYVAPDSNAVEQVSRVGKLLVGLRRALRNRDP
jgi:four helix bundle protein